MESKPRLRNPNHARRTGEPDAEHVLFEAPEFATAAVAAATGSAGSAGEKLSARARKQPARFRPAVDAPKPAGETEVIVPWRPKRRRQETDFFKPTEVLHDMATGARKRKRPAVAAGPCIGACENEDSKRARAERDARRSGLLRRPSCS